MHEGCCKLLLDNFTIPEVDRPSLDDREPPENVAVVFCTKGCFTKWKAQKKKEAKEAEALLKEANKKKRRVPWEEDGSMEALMDWLTTHGSYADYCGANSNRGTSKAQCHKEIASFILNKKPETDRTDKDVDRE